jgi:hypothetical protein
MLPAQRGIAGSDYDSFKGIRRRIDMPGLVRMIKSFNSFQDIYEGVRGSGVRSGGAFMPRGIVSSDFIACVFSLCHGIMHNFQKLVPSAHKIWSKANER